MRAVDTNIAVRFITRDDENQALRARAALASGDLFLPTSVVLEIEWVLHSGYKFERASIAKALTRIAGLPGITIEQPAAVAQAIGWFNGGMDFADALHLASAAGCEAMLSFDTKLAKAAKRLGTIPVVAP